VARVASCAHRGDIGSAAGYLDGHWECEDVEALVELSARNGSRLMDALSGVLPFRLFNWLAHRFKSWRGLRRVLTGAVTGNAKMSKRWWS
jgi:hypothetical protein